MAPRILILTTPEDEHAYVVAEALRRKGAEVVQWQASDFPTYATESVLFEGGRRTLRLEGPGFSGTDAGFTSVWRRRPSLVFRRDEELLHPDDRAFAEAERAAFRSGLWHVLAPEAFWVNPLDAGGGPGDEKLAQHQLAADVGLATPDALYGNSPREIRAFLARHGGRIVFKPFGRFSWRRGDERAIPTTSLLTAEDLVDDDLLQAVPGIYQELLPKAFELRVTVMGRHAFAAKILSQETEAGRLDWRRAFREVRLEPYEMPAGLEEKCQALLGRLGFVFGSFDLVVKPDGGIVFLEVNDWGQFLFVEKALGLPLLDAFTELLLQGRADLAWDPRAVALRLGDVEAEAMAAARRAAALHPARDESFGRTEET